MDQKNNRTESSIERPKENDDRLRSAPDPNDPKTSREEKDVEDQNEEENDEPVTDGQRGTGIPGFGV